MKTIYIIILVLLFSNLQAQSLEDVSFGTDETFEVITWNIEWFPKNGQSTIDSVKNIIRALDADVLALQEISDTFALQQLMDSLDGYATLYFSNNHRGLVYIYKNSSVQVQDYYPIFSIPSFSNFFPRAPQVLELTFKGEEYIIINNHLKCCGDGQLVIGNNSDEENRRYQAMELLKSYMDSQFGDKNVLLVGDLNDNLADVYFNNVFQSVIDDSLNYFFADMSIAEGTNFNWSYPSWPSHLDHIMITNELFDELGNSNTIVETIRVDDFMVGGFSAFDSKVTDHRPVGIRFEPNSTNTTTISDNRKWLSIYPNPAKQFLNITFENAIDNIQLELYNINGQLLKTKVINNQQVSYQWDISDVPNGLYFVKLSNFNGLQIIEKVAILND